MSTSDSRPPNVAQKVIMGPLAGTALLGCMAGALPQDASAAFVTTEVLTNGTIAGPVNFAGLTLTNIVCSDTGNTCNSLEIEQINVGRGIVELEILNTTTTSPIFTITSGTATDTLTVSYTATTDLPATAKISATQLTLNVTNTGTWSSSVNAGWSQTDSLTPSPAAIAITSGTTTTASDAKDTFGTAGSVDAVSYASGQDISLVRTSGSGVSITLQNAIQEFFITPEPASIGAFLIGLGGLAAARRRRQR